MLLKSRATLVQKNIVAPVVVFSVAVKAETNADVDRDKIMRLYNGSSAHGKANHSVDSSQAEPTLNQH